MTGHRTEKFRPVFAYYPRIACFADPNDLEIVLCDYPRVYCDSNCALECLIHVNRDMESYGAGLPLCREHSAGRRCTGPSYFVHLMLERDVAVAKLRVVG